MDEPKTRNGGSVCRICDRNASETHSVFEKNDEGQQLIQLIRECLPIVIYRRDPLSKEVCSDCLDHLVTFYKFRKDSVGAADRQVERLKNGARTNAVDLYLGQLENDVLEQSEHHHPQPSIASPVQQNHLSGKPSFVDRTTSPFENGHDAYLPPPPCNCRTFTTAEPENNEIEMCAELHKAIADSLKESNQRLTEDSRLRGKRKRNEGFYAEFDESQDSSVTTTDFTYTESTRNTESHSDMELCDSDQECVRRVVDIHPAKRRRIMGPKSIQDAHEKERMIHIFNTEQTFVYNPFSLTRLVLNAINYENVPDFWSPTCEKTLVQLENICNYCDQKFPNVKLLAIHEAEHINIELGARVDDSNVWEELREDADVRNKWLESFCEEGSVEEVSRVVKENGESMEGDLLVPVKEPKGQITLVDGKAMVNGTPLTDIPKDERKLLYETIMISGMKRKFCPLCRYTFKDNWAIESHYLSSSCHYTCRYCGIRFNKQRYQFDEHIQEHISKGDQPSTKMFAPRKWNTTYPRIIQENQLKPRTSLTRTRQQSSTSRTPKAPPSPDMRHLLERRSLQPNLRLKVKSEFNETPPMRAPSARSTPKQSPPPPPKLSLPAKPTSNQAYFCRKCYQVFFRLEEFNVHVTTCKGERRKEAVREEVKPKVVGEDVTLLKPVREEVKAPMATAGDGETYSRTGRPMRHCVKEVGTYKDEPDIGRDDGREQRLRNKLHSAKIVRSKRGFECGQCDAAFPTVHSRNSHMRIHKATSASPEKNPFSVYDRNHHYDDYEDSHYPTSHPNVKQEPLEPIVEINESPHSFPSSIGSVSITPIPKAKINPNIMKLVQQNPHLTIKGMSGGGGNYTAVQQSSSVQQQQHVETEKTYKCANCSRSFTNKSHLYFHKKNQCGGSKYPCPFCKKRFGTEAAYSAHIFYSHPE